MQCSHKSGQGNEKAACLMSSACFSVYWGWFWSTCTLNIVPNLVSYKFSIFPLSIKIALMKIDQKMQMIFGFLRCPEYEAKTVLSWIWDASSYCVHSNRKMKLLPCSSASWAEVLEGSGTSPSSAVSDWCSSEQSASMFLFSSWSFELVSSLGKKFFRVFPRTHE